MEQVSAAGDSGIALIQSEPSRLWTPEAGPSGLIVVARPRPLLAVVGNQVLTVPADRPAFAERRRETVTLSGLFIISTSRQGEPTHVIGHPDLASGASVRQGDTLYVSVAEAIYRQKQGEDVDIHLHPTEEDKEALAGFRARARRRWENDRLPDGWTRPLPPPPTPKEIESPRSDQELPEELRDLAKQLRTKYSASPGEE